MNQYEGMFLFDPTFGASFENCEAEVGRLLERAEAELVFCRKWDERRLAYRIQGRKRGVYVLTYFKARAEKIGSLERDAQLSEDILRLLVLRAEGVTSEAMEDAMTLSAAAPGGEEGGFDRRRESTEPVGARPRAVSPPEGDAKPEPKGADVAE